MIDPGIEGRVAIVTGGNHGIGAATVRALAAQGVKVFITYLRLVEEAEDAVVPDTYSRNRAQAADAIVAEIREKDGQAEAWEGDLGDPAAIPQLFDRTESQLGPVDILIHNAAAWMADTFLSESTDRLGRRLNPLSAASHDLHFAVNSRATALLIAEFAHRFRERGAAWGRIITVTTGGSGGFPEEVSYGASKNALESYTMAAAWELGQFGITANVVCPPATDTGWIPEASREEIAQGSPLRRICTPNQVADVILFLVSQQAAAVTADKIVMR
ncbi:MAG: SDR family oxidoreductase [Chloroflexota bacterium]|nr:SDR family oxidoreductase [Chloroflexota bacterium]